MILFFQSCSIYEFKAVNPIDVNKSEGFVCHYEHIFKNHFWVTNGVTEPLNF